MNVSARVQSAVFFAHFFISSVLSLLSASLRPTRFTARRLHYGGALGEPEASRVSGVSRKAPFPRSRSWGRCHLPAAPDWFTSFVSENYLLVLFTFLYTGVGCVALLMKKLAELVEQAWGYYKAARRSYLDFHDELNARSQKRMTRSP